MKYYQHEKIIYKFEENSKIWSCYDINHGWNIPNWMSENPPGKDWKEISEEDAFAWVMANPQMEPVGWDARLPKVLIPMMRRTFPELITSEIVGVQPMSDSKGLSFALKYNYGKKK